MQYQINGQYHNVDIELEKVKLSAIISCYDHLSQLTIMIKPLLSL